MGSLLKESSFICWLLTPPAHTEQSPLLYKSPKVSPGQGFPHLLHYRPSPTSLMLAAHDVTAQGVAWSSGAVPPEELVLRCAASPPSDCPGGAVMPNQKNHVLNITFSYEQGKMQILHDRHF